MLLTRGKDALSHIYISLYKTNESYIMQKMMMLLQIGNFHLLIITLVFFFCCVVNWRQFKYVLHIQIGSYYLHILLFYHNVLNVE